MPTVFRVEAEHTLDKTRKHESVCGTRASAVKRIREIGELISEWPFDGDPPEDLNVFRFGIIKLHIIEEPLL